MLQHKNNSDYFLLQVDNNSRKVKATNTWVCSECLRYLIRYLVRQSRQIMSFTHCLLNSSKVGKWYQSDYFWNSCNMTWAKKLWECLLFLCDSNTWFIFQTWVQPFYLFLIRLELMCYFLRILKYDDLNWGCKPESDDMSNNYFLISLKQHKFYSTSNTKGFLLL